MSLRWSLVAVLLGAPLVACAPSVVTPHVQYVWTSTPGVVFVIVQPSKQDRKQYPMQADVGSQTPVDPRSWYVLLCDARKGEGMHCDIASEAALKRYSYTPATTASAPPLEESVGTLGDRIHIEHEEKAAPPPAPPAPPPPPPPPPAPPTGGKK